MRVLLSTYGSRGDVEPMVGLAVCAPNFAELMVGGVAVPLATTGGWR